MSTLSKTVMLVSLNVRGYSARAEDKKISREVAATHNTSVDNGKYSKQLVAKRFLDPITKAAGALRQYHYEHSLPWLDDGVRVLPSAMYETYKAGMLALLDDYDSATRLFCDIWQSEIIPDARQRLNGMFNYSDYPTDIGARFGCRYKFMPVPDASDFRVDIADSEREALREQIAETLGAAQETAMRELWERVAEAVKAMADRLAAYKNVIVNGKAKVENPFRDSLVENLRDLCALIPQLNFANDPRLETIRQQIAAELLANSADMLRDRDTVREDVAAKAAQIAARVSEFMAG